MTISPRALRASSPFIVALALSGCGPKGPEGHGGPGGGMPPALVAVQEVKPRSIPVEFEYPAQTAGSREVEVRARVAGILLKRNFEEGAAVRVGQSNRCVIRSRDPCGTGTTGCAAGCIAQFAP